MFATVNWFAALSAIAHKANFHLLKTALPHRKSMPLGASLSPKNAFGYLTAK